MVKDQSWPETAVDRFILAKLEQEGLRPTKAADKRTLIRRATFDLIGLPPTPEEIDAFLKDTSPDALARVLDRLLASPHYGERWGRYWLDLARYADSVGATDGIAAPSANAFRYRDWVVRAFNSDMPYDQFIKAMVQIYFGKRQPWDSHDDIRVHGGLAKQADGPIPALVQDLKSRGLLDKTLVIVGSEFGRTPFNQNTGVTVAGVGRDHNEKGFTALLAGGGVKRGIVYGATDEFGCKAVENPVHVHDLHATILHLLGVDHTRLTYRYSGRDFRLTDAAGNVVKDILA